MATTSRGITLVDGSTIVNPIQPALNQIANDVDDALSDLADEFVESQGYFIGTNAQRLALAAPKLRNGITWAATDTGVIWRRLAGAWTADTPFRQYHGSSSVTAALTTITFPSGMFTVAPHLLVTGYSAPLVGVPYIVAASITATQFQARIFSLAGNPIAGQINWTATQATPGSAVG